MKNDINSAARWRASRENIQQGKSEKVMLSSHGELMTFAEVLSGWQTDADFQRFFLTELRRTPYPAFYWEMPPIQHNSLDRPYEYVVLDGGALDRIGPDPSAFLDELDATEHTGSVASFPNLGGDAMLVVPKPVGSGPGYGHIGSFLRLAPDHQQHDLLVVSAVTVLSKLQSSARPVWISTAGLGVPWLHVRLDSRPKYYRHMPYRIA